MALNCLPSLLNGSEALLHNSGETTYCKVIRTAGRPPCRLRWMHRKGRTLWWA